MGSLLLLMRGGAILPMTGRCREPNCHAMVIRPLHYSFTKSKIEEIYNEIIITRN